MKLGNTVFLLGHIFISTSYLTVESEDDLRE